VLKLAGTDTKSTSLPVTTSIIDNKASTKKKSTVTISSIGNKQSEYKEEEYGDYLEHRLNKASTKRKRTAISTVTTSIIG